MKTGDVLLTIMWTVFITVMLMAVINTNLPGSKVYRYNAAMEQCEKSLPRDQHCVIVAVPNNSKVIVEPK